MDKQQPVDADRVLNCEKHRYQVKKICTLKECKDRFICVMCRHSNDHERHVVQYAEILDELLYTEYKNLLIKSIQVCQPSKSKDAFKSITKKMNTIMTKGRDKVENEIKKQFEENLRKFFDVKFEKIMEKCQVLECSSIDDLFRKRDLFFSKIREALRDTDDSDDLYYYFERFFSGGILSAILDHEIARFERLSNESFEDSKKLLKKFFDALGKDELESLLERKEEKNVMNQKAFNNSIIDFRNQSVAEGGLDGSVNGNRGESRKIENFLEVNQHKLLAYSDNSIALHTCFFANKECKEECKKGTRDKCYSTCKVCLPCQTHDFLLTLEPQTDMFKLWSIREREFEKVSDLSISPEGISRQLMFLSDTKPQSFRAVTDYDNIDMSKHNLSSLNFVRVSDKNKLELWEILIDLMPNLHKDSYKSCSMVLTQDLDLEPVFMYYDSYDYRLILILKDQRVLLYSFDPNAKTLEMACEPLLIRENQGKVINFSKVNFDQYCYLTNLDRLVVLNIEQSGIKAEPLSLFRPVSWGGSYGLGKYAVCYLNETTKKFCIDILEVNEKRWKNAEVALDERMNTGMLLGDRKEVLYDRGGGMISFFTGK